MKQKLLKLMCLLCVGVMSMNAWGQELTTAYTLTPTGGSNNAYAGNCDIIINGITWNLTGNSTFQPWRIGGKSLTDTDRTLYSKTAIDDDIVKISVTHGAASSITVNSFSLGVYSDADFEVEVETQTKTFEANSTINFTPSPGKSWDGCYYKFTYNVTVSVNSNKFIEFSEAVFYKESGGGGSSAAATTTTIDASGITNTDVYVGTTAGSLSASVTETESGDDVDGATVTWSGNNDAVATINATTGAVTLVAAGTVTFTASYAGETGTYVASSDTYEMTVTSSEPYVQPTNIEITPNFTFWGKDAQFSANAYDDLSGTKDNVTLDWTRGTGSTYANTTAMRFYKDNELTFTAPTGYSITSIVLAGTLKGDESFSPDGFNTTTQTWTGTSETVTMSRPSDASSYSTISKYTITIAENRAVATPTFSVAEGSYYAAQDVTITCATGGATIYYTTDGSTPTTSSSVYSSAIPVSTTTTLKAIAVKGDDESFVASATYTLPEHAGTAVDPFTIADAKLAINAGISSSTDYYVTGKICQIDSYNSTYNSITYWISDDGTTTDKFECYGGLSFDKTDFTGTDNLQLGNTVVVKGKLTKYGSTYELNKDNVLVSMNYTRTVTEGNWGTICLPYDATVTGAKLYTISHKELDGSSNPTALILSEETGIVGGFPYIFKATGSELVATYTSSSYEDATDVDGLHGTYDAIEKGDFTSSLVPNDDLYLMTATTVQAANYATASVGANRAYILMEEVPTSGSPVKGVRLGFDGSEEATGITELTEKTEATEGIYNLQGQQLSAPQRGINIIGGKKVLVK